MTRVRACEKKRRATKDDDVMIMLDVWCAWNYSENDGRLNFFYLIFFASTYTH